MHISRKKRWGHYGPAEAVTAAQGEGVIVVNGYRRLWDPLHPLAMKGGYVPQHRAVLYALIGPGEHECHWCGVSVAWGTTGMKACYKGVLVVDHVDGDKSNNGGSNLVPSCSACNINRSNEARLTR